MIVVINGMDLTEPEFGANLADTENTRPRPHYPFGAP